MAHRANCRPSRPPASSSSAQVVMPLQEREGRAKASKGGRSGSGWQRCMTEAWVGASASAASSMVCRQRQAAEGRCQAPPAGRAQHSTAHTAHTAHDNKHLHWVHSTSNSTAHSAHSALTPGQGSPPPGAWLAGCPGTGWQLQPRPAPLQWPTPPGTGRGGSHRRQSSRRVRWRSARTAP